MTRIARSRIDVRHALSFRTPRSLAVARPPCGQERVRARASPAPWAHARGLGRRRCGLRRGASGADARPDALGARTRFGRLARPLRIGAFLRSRQGGGDARDVRARRVAHLRRGVAGAVDRLRGGRGRRGGRSDGRATPAIGGGGRRRAWGSDPRTRGGWLARRRDAMAGLRTSLDARGRSPSDLALDAREEQARAMWRLGGELAWRRLCGVRRCGRRHKRAASRRRAAGGGGR